MTGLPSKPCNKPGCGRLTKGPYCNRHIGLSRRLRDIEFDRNRASASRRGYDRRWQRFRKYYLQDHLICEALGCSQPASEVDHIIPLAQGGAHCDEDNSQALCKPHHSAKTAREVGFVGGNGHRAQGEGG